MATARYFPVEPTPLKMVASLARFGTDFGQGPLDSLFFQEDEERERYLRAKRAAPAKRHFVVGDDPVAIAARAEAHAWMMKTLHEEWPIVAAEIEADSAGENDFEAIARHVQEDFAILQAGQDDAGRTLVVDVRFPSGWHPERLKEAGFDAIHRPVPGFPPGKKASQGMVRAMVDRGPYVRFVWTVGADPALDQHPDLGGRLAKWHNATDAYFRVERQVTIPLPKTRSSVFLIRTYVRPVSDLSAEERVVLRQALDQMPADVRAYKSLPDPETLSRFVGEP